MRAEDFLSIITPKKQGGPFKIGTIPGDYVSGRPQVIFDGESTASAKTYTYLESYTPAPNDRVLLGAVGHSWVILGKII